MSGKKPPPTALIRRASPDLSDEDISSLLHRSRLFGKRLHALLDPDASPRIRFYDDGADARGASYVIYSETTRRFIGFRRNEVYHLDGSQTSRRMQLVFYPAAQA